MLNPFEPVGTVLIVFSNNLLRANLHIMVYDQMPGAPNENVVQNHLNIALLNVFQYLNGRYRHIFIPSGKSSDSKIIGIKTYLFENFSQKKGSRKFQVTFLRKKSVKKRAIIPFFRCSKEILQQMFRKFQSQIVFRTDIFQKLTLGAPGSYASVVIYEASRG